MEKKFYLIYKITNLINNMFYIGAHGTNDPDDSYMGSGKRLKRAIYKHGKENFLKEIICVCDNEKQMYIIEKLWVDEEFLKRKDVYNLHLGGGGYNNPRMTGKSHTEETKRKIGKNSIKLKGYKHTEETKRKMSKAKLGISTGPKSEEMKARIAATQRIRMSSPEIRKQISEKLTGRVQTEEHRKNQAEAMKQQSVRDKIRNKAIGRILTDETKLKISIVTKGRVWVKKEGISERIYKEELEERLSSGWEKGRVYPDKRKPHSEEAKEKMRKKHHMKQKAQDINTIEDN